MELGFSLLGGISLFFRVGAFHKKEEEETSPSFLVFLNRKSNTHSTLSRYARYMISSRPSLTIYPNSFFSRGEFSMTSTRSGL